MVRPFALLVLALLPISAAACGVSASYSPPFGNSGSAPTAAPVTQTAPSPQPAAAVTNGAAPAPSSAPSPPQAHITVGIYSGCPTGLYRGPKAGECLGGDGYPQMCEQPASADCEGALAAFRCLVGHGSPASAFGSNDPVAAACDADPSVGTGFIGATVEDYGGLGALVVSVTAGSAAASVGLASGAVITGIFVDGQRRAVSSADGFVAAMKDTVPGESAQVIYGWASLGGVPTVMRSTTSGLVALGSAR